MSLALGKQRRFEWYIVNAAFFIERPVFQHAGIMHSCRKLKRRLMGKLYDRSD
jgi:hypothetical protein